MFFYVDLIYSPKLGYIRRNYPTWTPFLNLLLSEAMFPCREMGNYLLGMMYLDS